MTSDFLRRAPKVELHVHLEGSIRPETLLRLAKRHSVALPADSLEGLQDWYRFRDFEHFVQIYLTVSSCIRDAADVELVAEEFLQRQAEQNVLHTEATFTMWTIRRQSGISLEDQLAAFNRAKASAMVSSSLVLDIVREESAEDGMAMAEFAIANHGNGICALGLTGVESKSHPLKHQKAFERAKEAELPITCHAGETSGPETIWSCLRDLGADRIGHGIRCLDDPALVKELRGRQVHLEVCPTSNVALGLVPSLAAHPLPEMLNEGLNVSINSDDPPMFGTTITDELVRCSETFGFNEDVLFTLTQNAARAAFIGDEERRALLDQVRQGYSAFSA